ncbi:hypothetical protein E2P81_ATG06260 [Venturia nashicola]|nr:hypothetical protein E2P81_ATG06260 [Venturia nashicola]
MEKKFAMPFPTQLPTTRVLPPRVLPPRVLGHTLPRPKFSTVTGNARQSLRRSIGIYEGLRDLTRTSSSLRTETEPGISGRTSVRLDYTAELLDYTAEQLDHTVKQTTHTAEQPTQKPQVGSNRSSQQSYYYTPSSTPRTSSASTFPLSSTPTTSSPLSPRSQQSTDGMSRRLKKGTRGLFSRLFVKPYESIPTHGSVHNLARVGGVSVLCLPMEFAVCDLVIPTRFAACGQFLVDFGIQVPGLFRIPGQTRTITALKDHFLGHLYLDSFTTPHQQDIEVTVRLAALPSQSVVAYNIHDVASTFKFFLGELDGGILGSVDVFESLRKVLLPNTNTKAGRSKEKEKERTSLEWVCRGIDTEVNEEEDDGMEVRWVARVLCGIECAQRRNLILGVFGILAMLKQDPVDSVMGSPSRERGFPLTFSDTLQELSAEFPSTATNERMSSKALSLVFAPLLLGNLTDQIHIEEKKHHHTLSSPAIFRRRSASRTSSSLHLKRFSKNPAQPQHSPSLSAHACTSGFGYSGSPSKHNHISAPIHLSGKNNRPFGEKLRKVGGGGKASISQGRELGDGVERNRISAKIIERLVRNWEGVVDCLRDGGFAGSFGGVGTGGC